MTLQILADPDGPGADFDVPGFAACLIRKAAELRAAGRDELAAKLETLARQANPQLTN